MSFSGFRRVAFGLCLTMAGVVSAESLSTPALRVRVVDMAPDYFLGEDGRWRGVEIDLIARLLQRSGFHPEYIPVPLARAQLEIQAGQLDILPSLTRTPERSLWLEWLGPTRHSRMALIVASQHENWPIRNLDDLLALCERENQRFGYIKGAYYGREFMQRLATQPRFSACLEPVAQQEQNVRKTLAGHSLGFFAERFTMAYRIEHLADFRGLSVHQFELPMEPGSEAAYIGISKRLPLNVRTRLRLSWEEMEKTGEVNEILAHWLSRDGR